MTGGPTGEEPLTPQQEDVVARLLAEAAGPVSMPADVAARLDGVLADLVAERSGAGETAAEPPDTGVPARGTDDLARARARRRWPRVLLAAAAVVVGGYTVGTVATGGGVGGSADSASSGADSSIVQEDSSDDARALEDQDGGGAASGDVESAPKANEGTSGMSLVVPLRLSPDTLERDVRRALRLLDTVPAASLSRETTDRADSACPGPAIGGRDRALPVRYDGEPAVLVAGPERRGTVEVGVHACDGELLERVEVPR